MKRILKAIEAELRAEAPKRWLVTEPKASLPQCAREKHRPHFPQDFTRIGFLYLMNYSPKIGSKKMLTLQLCADNLLWPQQLYLLEYPFSCLTEARAWTSSTWAGILLHLRYSSVSLKGVEYFAIIQIQDKEKYK